MSPTVIAALITAGGRIGESVFQKIGTATKRESDDAANFMNQRYNDFKAMAGTSNTKLLLHIESGAPFEFRRLYTDLFRGYGTLDPNIQEALEAEFMQRLQYLVTIGLVIHTGTDYIITTMGKHYLAKAREDVGFARLFHPSDF
ncbi:MAG TPA: hypothetical protein VGL56_02560 [Fimbriimonadaceae bacterium]|jgi:hypothetical protein